MNATKYYILFGLLTLCLSGCGGGNTAAVVDDPADAAQNAAAIEVEVDATAGGIGTAADDPANKYTYYDLDAGEVVDLTDAEAALSTVWDIAFKRSNTKLNGGVSGPGSVTGALADAQDEFYDTNGDPDLSVFSNVTAETELVSLEAITDTSAFTFESDRDIAAITGDGSSDGWWLYDFATNAVSANADAWWLVRSASGDSYVKFHVTDIVQVSRDITLEMFIQGSADSAFSTTATDYTAAIGAAGGAKCYDIDTAAEVDCDTAADDWDLKIEVSTDGRGWNIWTNSGISGSGSGGSFGPLATADIDDYVSGTVTGSGINISTLYSVDSSGGLFADSNWWDYNLEGNNRLWPNYRVYVIDTGTAQYKLQVLQYYDTAGVSGMITFRYEEI